MKVTVYDIHTIKNKDVDLIFKNGIAYKPGCYNCKHCSADTQYDKFWDEYQHNCWMACIKDVCENDICDRFVFEPKVPYKFRSRL